MNYTTEDKEQAVKVMLEMVGEDPERTGLKDTPKRVVRMWNEIFRGYDETQKPKVTVFPNGEDGLIVDQMICDTGSFVSHCEHHMVPFIGKYWFAYIPKAKGKILGLSKVARVVDFYSAKLQVQERLGSDIINYLWKELDKPLAMGLVLEAEHFCKTIRGVKKKGTMRSTELKGTIKEIASAKSEFLNWVNK